MKIFIIFLFLIIALLFISCGNRDLIDKSKSKFYYKNRKSKIFFKSENAPDVTALWNYNWIEVPADEQSFIVIDKYYAKDQQHYFKHGKILNVDYDSFVIGYNGLVKDKNHVYKNHNPYQILKEANPEFFERIRPENFELPENQYWSKDDKHYFMQDEIADVDYQSFKFLTPRFFIDDNSIFYYSGYRKLDKIENKNPSNTNFKVLDSYVIHSDSYFYFNQYTGRDTIIELPVKNTASIKMYSKRDYFSIDGVVYFQGKLVEDADMETFETFGNGDAVFYAKDKNNVYENTTIIPDANPQTVKYNKDEKTIEEGDYIWKWNGNEKKSIKVKKKTPI